MPELGGTLSGLIDVMRAKPVQQVTGWPTGALYLTCSSAQRLTPGWIQSRSDGF